MKKTILLILTMLILTACKTKTSVKSKIQEKEIIKTESVKKDENLIQKQEVKKEVKKEEVSEAGKKSETEFEIKGQAKTDEPFEVHEIKNGDTVQSFTVVGNADIYLKNKRIESKLNKTEKSSSSLENTLKEFTKSLINEKKLNEKVTEINEAKKQIVTRTGTFWSFGLIGGLGAFALLLIATFIYFKNYRKNEKD